MKLKTSLAAGAALTCVTIGALTPSAALADSSVAFSQATICPGESVTLTVNGISDGTVVNLTAPEYATAYSTSLAPFSLFTTASTGIFPYGALQSFVGETYTYEIVNSSDGSVAGIQSVVSAASIQVLAECEAPTPDPEAEAEALPNTGSSTEQITALALGGTALALGGIALARRARSSKATR